jgi:hypothetical protein
MQQKTATAYFEVLYRRRHGWIEENREKVQA